MADGFNQIVISNSDTPDHNDIHRWVDAEGIDTHIRIAANRGVDATFDDYHVASALPVRYFIRSYLTPGSSGGYTDSDPSSVITNVLDGLWITQVTSASATSNSALSLNLFIEGASKTVAEQSSQVKFAGRTKELTFYGQNTFTQVSYDVKIPNADLAKLDILVALYEANATLCVRDSRGNRIFGRLNPFSMQDAIMGDFFSISFHDQRFTEAV